MNPNGTYARDPVSEWMDEGARRLLARLYAAPRGQWVGTLLQVPGPQHFARAATLGINLLGYDKSKRAVDTRMRRWPAAFCRALYYNHKWYYTGGRLAGDKRLSAASTRALEFQVGNLGRIKPAFGIFPAGYVVRVRTRPGGAAARRAVAKMPDERRIFLEGAAPGGKHHDPADQDW